MDEAAPPASAEGLFGSALVTYLFSFSLAPFASGHEGKNLSSRLNFDQIFAVPIVTLIGS